MFNNISFSMMNLDQAEPVVVQDRFIQSRANLENMTNIFKLASDNSIMRDDDSHPNENKKVMSMIKQNMLNSRKKYSKTFKDFMQIEEPALSIPELFYKKRLRRINKSPFKVLDAPELVDDYYFNIVDWSRSNVLVVGLSQNLYSWGFDSNKVEKLMSYGKYNFITNVTFDQQSDKLMFGQSQGECKLMDLHTKQVVRTFTHHKKRVCAISLNGDRLITGSRDKRIVFLDLRAAQPQSVYKDHTQEVCGLKWSRDGQYFASGGNDNFLFVYSPKVQVPLMMKKHKAAVKAIDWSKKTRGLLITGSGSKDKCLRLFDVQTKKLIDIKDTGSQVCNVVFSRHNDEIISAHGFSENEINLWSRDFKKL